MTPERTTDQRVHCPTCGQKAKRVSPVTLRALLKGDTASTIAAAGDSCRDANPHRDSGCQPNSGDTGWRFCEAKGCDVVYFSEDGNATFTKLQVRVEVGIKETAGERPLCYCFGHSVASIKDELRGKGHSDALGDIRQKMQDPGCRCETENPAGSCCLGSVTNGIKIAQRELGMNDTAGQTAPAKSSIGKGEKIAKIGTVVSAIMASSCCWLPLVLLAVGVSGAGVAATLEAYRPFFAAVTFGFLGAAFYFTYRPQKAAAGGGHGCCATEPASGEDCCAPAAEGRGNMMRLNKAMLWVVTVMAVAFLLFPSYVGAFLGRGDETTVTDDMNTAVIRVEGMTCEGCSALVARAIRTVPGVLAVEVDYQKGAAVVGTEIGRPVPEADILTALEESGYRGTVVQDSLRQTPPAKPAARTDTRGSANL